MITIEARDKKLLEQIVEGYLIIIEEGFSSDKQIKDLSKQIPVLPELIEQQKFTGKLLSSLVIPCQLHDQMAHVFLIGMGKIEKKYKVQSIENLRRAVAHGLRRAAAFKCSSVALQLPSPDLCGVTSAYYAQQVTTVAHMQAYQFVDYITDEDRKRTPLDNLILCVDTTQVKDMRAGIKDGNIIAQAVNTARHWIDTPPSDITPPILAEKAKAIAQEHGLKFTMFNEKQVTDMGMGGLAGVSRGSDVECRMVILEYRTKKKMAPTLVFVGKGITFDSGGLSLKPAAAMETMKDDMSGAAAIMVTMQALAQLKPDLNVVGIAPMSENLPSGKAVKPGDILRFYNGKTAEVKNTDAEGRLILADALSYGVKHYKPDAIIDVATLTGACAHALGPFFSGLMSQHDELVERIQMASDLSGDRVWRLPMDNDYKKAIRSDVADLCNIGSGNYKAGAITAAYFLQHFVDDVPWAHLDIAGTAFDVPDMPYYTTGATGAGVRLLIDLAMNWK
jgi:leucyl aminopeptidase